MENNFKFEIISPEKVIFSGEATMAKLPSFDGDMSILKNHISIITFLRPGIVRVEKQDGTFEDFFVQDGIVEYFKDALILLSASAQNIKDLTKDFLDNLNKTTETELSKKDLSDKDRYILNHKLDVLKEIRV